MRIQIVTFGVTSPNFDAVNVSDAIWSTLLYASETWVLNAETEGRITSLEMWRYRRMLKIYTPYTSKWWRHFTRLECKTTAHKSDKISADTSTSLYS